MLTPAVFGERDRLGTTIQQPRFALPNALSGEVGRLRVWQIYATTRARRTSGGTAGTPLAEGLLRAGERPPVLTPHSK